MGTPLSLRLARLLLVAAGALTIGTAAYIAVQTSSIAVAAPWLALLILNGTAFIGAAVAMGALGTITGFGAGMLSFPAIGLGALGAWAAFATPETYQPAVTCRVNGGGSAVPLAWELRGTGGSLSFSGSSGTSAATPGITSGEIRRGDRVATYRCEGDRLVDYRETR